MTTTKARQASPRVGTLMPETVSSIEQLISQEDRALKGSLAHEEPPFSYALIHTHG